MSATDEETLIASLGKLNKVMADAQLGSKAAADAFRSIGLDASQFTNVADALPAIADKIAGIQNPAHAAAAAMALFGKSGAELLPFLQQGSAGIAALEARAKELGIVVNSTDVAKIGAANDAIDELKTAIVGVGHAIAIQVAPFITYFSKKLTDSGYLGQAASKWIVTGLEWITTGIAYAVDSIRYFEASWYVLKSAVGVVATAISVVIAALVTATVEAINGLFEFAGIGRSEALDSASEAVKEFTKGMSMETAKAFEDAGKALDKPSAIEGVKNFFDGIRKGADEAAQSVTEATKPIEVMSDTMIKLGDDIANLTEDWKNQSLTFAMSSREAEIFKLAQQGATEEQLAALKELNAQLNKQEELKKLTDEGKSLTESLRTPLEKYQDELAKFEKLFASGAISQETFDRATKKAKTDLEQSSGETQLAGVATLNSTEAFSSIARAQNFGKADPMSRVADVSEEQLAEAKLQSRILQRLARVEEESFSLA